MYNFIIAEIFGKGLINYEQSPYFRDFGVLYQENICILYKITIPELNDDYRNMYK